MGFRDELKGLSAGVLATLGSVATGISDALIKGDDESADSAPGGKNADTAKTNPVPTEPAKDDPQSLFWDPFAIIEQLGYTDRPSAITYGTLKAMVYKTPIISAIIQTRINQVASFARPQHDKYQLGFRIKLRDQEKEPTPEDRKWIAQMESLIMRTGVTNNPRGRDNFEVFLRKITWDSLTYDQSCIEIVSNRKGQPAEWYAVDASTFRLASNSTTFIDEDDEQAIRYVQIYDGMIINEYTQNQLNFGIRNPRTDIRLHSYGTSELEMLVMAITSVLYAWEYNQRGFSQGSMAKGIINFKGPMSGKQLQSFRRHWYQMLSGVSNAFRTPITNTEDLQYISLQQSSRDMEYNAWMDFLIKVVCSCYNMDPAEVNFQYGNTGQKSSLMGDNNKEKITESKERGLRPLLRFIANQMNQSIVWPINEDFEFDFIGLDAQTKDQTAELNTKRVKSIMTIDEVRAEEDKPPLPDGYGEIILDPTYIQYVQAKEGIGSGAPGQEGGFGEDGDEEGEGDEGDADYEKMLAKYESEEDDDDDDEDDNKKGKDVKKSMESNSGKIIVDLEI